MNAIMLLGNLGDNPELRTTQNGATYAYLRLCTSESYKDNAGEWQQSKEWHTLKIWNRSAERATQTLKRGDLVSVEGQLVSFELSEEKRRVWEVRVNKWRSWSKRDQSVERSGDYLLPRENVRIVSAENQSSPWGEGFARR